MPAKLIQVSDDGGTNFFTLPGNTGSMTFESDQLEDTVFGQTYESNEAGLIGWTVEANARYKGFAGYNADLFKQDTSTSMTTEAMTLVTGKIYQIDDQTKEIWDRLGTFVIFDNAIDHTADVDTFDYLFGRVEFNASYSVVEPVTVTGDFFTKKALGTMRNFTLTMTADAVETTDFDTAQTNGGFKTHDPGLRTVTFEASGFYNLTNAFLVELKNRNEIIIEINPDGSLQSLARGFFRAISEVQAGDVGALEEETITFALNVPDLTNLFRPFGWQDETTTTLADAIKKTIDAFQNETKVDVQYLSDGVAGEKGKAVVTDVSLTSGVDAMNEFACVYRGDGVPTTV